MAEMTVAEAKIFIAQELKALSGPEGCCIQSMQRNQTKRSNLRGLAAIIGQQAAEIERQTKAIGIFMSANQSPETYRQVKAALEEKP